jgi:copper transport protein
MPARSLFCVLLALGLLGVPVSALAHASLLSSDPADGAALDLPPATVVLKFDEEVALIQLRLLNPFGTEVLPSSPPQAVGGVVRAVYSPDDAQTGTYLLSYRVTSADSHPVAGAIVFGVGVGKLTQEISGAHAPADSGRWIIPVIIARWLFYLSVAAAVGGTAFRLLIAEFPTQLRRLLQLVAILGAALTVLQIGIRGAMLVDVPFVDLLTASTWKESFRTNLGLGLLVALAGMLVCAMGLAAKGGARRIFGGIAILLVLASFPLSGHAATAATRWLTLPALIIHAAVAVFWLGALWPLWMQLKSPGAAPAVQRFSSLAVSAVSLLVVMGALLAFVRIPHPIELFETRYGLLVSTKALLFVCLFCLGVWNRLRLTPALIARAPNAANRLRRIIGIEALIGAIVLVVTATLTLTPPSAGGPGSAGKKEDHLQHHDLQHHNLHAAGRVAMVEVSPGRAGRNAIRVLLNTRNDQPAPREVWVELSLPEAGVAGGVRRRLTPDSPSGSWVYEGPELFIPGRWTLRFEVLVTEFEQVSVETERVIE